MLLLSSVQTGSFSTVPLVVRCVYVQALCKLVCTNRFSLHGAVGSYIVRTRCALHKHVRINRFSERGAVGEYVCTNRFSRLWRRWCFLRMRARPLQTCLYKRVFQASGVVGVFLFGAAVNLSVQTRFSTPLGPRRSRWRYLFFRQPRGPR